jgi:hypothetical protein
LPPGEGGESDGNSSNDPTDSDTTRPEDSDIGGTPPGDTGGGNSSGDTITPIDNDIGPATGGDRTIDDTTQPTSPWPRPGGGFGLFKSTVQSAARGAGVNAASVSSGGGGTVAAARYVPSINAVQGAAIPDSAASFPGVVQTAYGLRDNVGFPAVFGSPEGKLSYGGIAAPGTLGGQPRDTVKESGGIAPGAGGPPEAIRLRATIQNLRAQEQLALEGGFPSEAGKARSTRIHYERVLRKFGYSAGEGIVGMSGTPRHADGVDSVRPLANARNQRKGAAALARVRGNAEIEELEKQERRLTGAASQRYLEYLKSTKEVIKIRMDLHDKEVDNLNTRDEARRQRRARKEVQKHLRRLDRRARAAATGLTAAAQNLPQMAEGAWHLTTVDNDADPNQGGMSATDVYEMGFGRHTTGNFMLPSFGGKGSANTVQGYLQQVRLAVNALQSVVVGAFGGETVYGGNLAVVEHNRPNANVAGSSIGQSVLGVTGLDTAVRPGQEPLAVVGSITAQEGATVTASGGVFKIIREHRGDGTINDKRPLLALHNGPGGADYWSDDRRRLFANKNRQIGCMGLHMGWLSGEKGSNDLVESIGQHAGTETFTNSFFALPYRRTWGNGLMTDLPGIQMYGQDAAPSTSAVPISTGLGTNGGGTFYVQAKTATAPTLPKFKDSDSNDFELVGIARRRRTIQKKTSNYTAGFGDYVYCQTNAFTVTLPATPAADDAGSVVVVRNDINNTNNITIDAGALTISDGTATTMTLFPGETIVLTVLDTTEWQI